MEANTREYFAKFASKETFDKIVEYPDVISMWKHSAEAYPNDVAIVDDGKNYTYAEIDTDVAKFRTVLKESGLRKGDKVALYAKNSYDFVKEYLAAVTYGLGVAILPAHLPEAAVFGCVTGFGLKAILTHEPLVGNTEFTVEKNPAVKVITADQTSDKETDAAEVKATDLCVIMFTGGTTGKSKGVKLSHGAVMQGAVNGCYGYPDVFGQRYMLVLPLSHVFGLIRNLMTSLYTGSALFICRNNKDMFKDVAVFKPTFLVAVPALAEMALGLSKRFGKNMLGESLKYIICGAATVAPYLVTEYKKIGIALFPGYGLTESANLVTGNVDNFNKPSSIGVPYPNQELKIVNGELWLKGKNMMDGYVNPDDNAAAYEDGWFKTGDLVKVDEEGFYYITGRIKELIILPNGENVSPAEVESHFNEIPFVQDSQLFEDIDEGGKRFLALEIVPRAAVVATLPADDKAAYMMSELERVNMTLPGFQRAARIVIRDKDFDRTPSMKIARYKKC